MRKRSAFKAIFLAAIATVGAFIMAGIIYFMILGVLSEVGVVPSTEVQSGSEVPERQISQLIANGIILEDEAVVFFYSEGIHSVLEGGNILTTERVVSYIKDEADKLQIYSINIKNIKGVELIEEGDFFTDSIYRINDGPDSWIEIWLSAENDGHLKFINALNAKLENQENVNAK